MKKHALAVVVMFSTIAGTAGTAAADSGDPNSEFDISYFYGAWHCEKDTETTNNLADPTEEHSAETWMFKPHALGKWTSFSWVTFGGADQHGGAGLWGFDPSRGKLVETGACDLGGYGYGYSDGWQGDTLTFSGEGFNFEGQDVSLSKALKKVSETEFVVTWDVASKNKSVLSHGSATCKR